MGLCCIKADDAIPDSPSHNPQPIIANEVKNYHKEISRDDDLLSKDIIEKLLPTDENISFDRTSSKDFKEENKEKNVYIEKEKYEDLLNEYNNSEHKLNELKGAKEKLEIEKAEVKDKYKQLQILYKESIERYEILETESKELKKSNEELKKSNKEYKKSIESIQTENTNLNKQLEETKNLLCKNDLNLNKYKIEIEIKDQNIKNLTFDYQNVISKLEDIENINKKIIQNNIISTELNSKLNNDILKLKDEKRELNEKYKSIEKEHKDYENKIGGITLEVFKNAEIKALKNELEIMQNNLIEIESKYRELQKKYVETRNGDSTEYYKKVINELQNTINFSGYY
ncbi:hypothetical protein SteCoe_1178 [Stentor coeruleus]|uniref:Uncharacterized protein n=1 Tax=Stentor coeruleus TaxID=5963 RepID=A0A1R2D2B3_9CILI|nr:hypothetical protein SteCoe_1178 [Stentor coeruleus]